MSLTLAGLSLFAFSLAGLAAPAGGGDDDKNKTIEAEILRTLRENGAITQVQFDDLMKLAAKLRAERAESDAEFSKEIASLDKLVRDRMAKAQSGPALPGTPVESFWKNGFNFRSADGKFSLHPWFVMRERLTLVDVGDRSGFTNQDTSSFEMRPMRLWFDGHIGTTDLTYLIMFDIASSTGQLRDAYLDYKFDDELHLRPGQQKRIVDRQGFTYAPVTSFVDKSSTTLFFQQFPGRDFDPGVSAWGELFDKQLEWRFGVFNNAPANNGPSTANIGIGGVGLLPLTANNGPSGMEVDARLTWNPMGPFPYNEGDYERIADPRASFGGWVNYAVNETLTGTPAVFRRSQVWTGGLDAAFKYDGFYALAEVIVRQTAQITPTTPDLTDYGWFAQAQYFFGSDVPNRGFEILGRWAQIDLDGQGVAVNTDTAVNDITGGVNYLFNGHRLKVGANYTYRIETVKAANNVYDSIAQIQFTAIF